MNHKPDAVQVVPNGVPGGCVATLSLATKITFIISVQ